MIRNPVALAILAFAAAGSFGTAQAEALRTHHFLTPPSVTHSGMLKPLSDRLARDTDGKLSLAVFPAMQLGGSPRQLYDQARDGFVDLAWTLPSYTAGRFPIVEVFELPFVGGSAEATSQAVTEFASLHLATEFRDVHVLQLHAHAPATLHMGERRVASLEDMRGLKIRVPGRAIADSITALGGNPVFMPVPDVQQSVARGVIDGAAIPFEVALPLRIHDVTRSHTSIGLYTGVFLLAMNKPRYAALPAELRQALDHNTGLGFAKEVGRMWDEAENPGRAAAQARGNEIIAIDPAERARWVAATRPVIDIWVAEMDKRGLPGAALLDDARRLIVKYESARADTGVSSSR